MISASALRLACSPTINVNPPMDVPMAIRCTLAENHMVQTTNAATEVFHRHAGTLAGTFCSAAWREQVGGLLVLVRGPLHEGATSRERAEAAARAQESVDGFAWVHGVAACLEALRAVKRAVLVLVVFRLAAKCGYDDKEAFLREAEAAFGQAPLDLQLQSRLLHAYYKNIVKSVIVD